MNRTLTIVKTAFLADQMGGVELPQVALAGRSNVGKSSLINCLAGRRQLAKTSATPGKTRSLNYYEVAPQGYCLVDLPGYGYARCSKAERDKWAELIGLYLRDNRLLRGVAVLLDCRLDPQQNDLTLTSYLQHLRLPITAVLTKADKCSQKERSQRQRQWGDLLGGGETPLVFSAKTGLGREALWRRLDALINVAGGATTAPAEP
ncbi:MAG: ribosome biogenesis GTP-binding protein YihA/YsxC [Desulfovibrionaceae bacterium]|jgi:GTP-binding protein|uniref:ribosome biogenesis GTP-binding protein YihA/YsxC n=1 Tax=Desulfovibrio aminophilus TaxID=81425 RepID=UPI00041146F5|nr:ribosome biogenesis GTP-binding protein YihA/YsxC [Desulfovibrio aminophilus]MDY0307731.1 ribosome biogenesis GTP-binding protein YihA/YsxC [Desulfovibrionaceae bacterium]